MISKYIKNKDLLLLAFTHRSWLNENEKATKSNERLEFLGDAVLEFVVSSFLYEKYPDKEEGFLTALRARLVNTASLAQVGKDLDLGDNLRLSKGEEETGGRTNDSLLANTVEAIIGAIYIENGVKAAEKFINLYILKYVSEFESKPLKDFKSRLQEAVQAKGMSAPKYVVVSEKGLDHDKTFSVQVVIDGNGYEVGVGKSKSLAAQAAAENTFNKFQ
ncbi:ribonuclease III [Patescibacteria group bacterium]